MAETRIVADTSWPPTSEPAIATQDELGKRTAIRVQNGPMGEQ